MGNGVEIPAPRPPSDLLRREASLPRYRRLRRLAFYGSVRGLAGLTRALPAPVARGLLAGLGNIAWRTRRAERSTALDQLALAFPESDAKWREQTGRRALESLGRNLADTVRGIEASPPSAEGLSRLRAAQSEGKGLIILTAHLGAWEMAGPILARNVPPLAAVTANPHNVRVDAWLRRWRAGRGVRSFDRQREALGAARWVKQGGTLALLADHRSAVASTKAPWFERPAPTPLGPARLAAWTGAPVVVVGVNRRAGQHELTVGPVLRRAASESDEIFATRANGALEAMIRRAPEEWTWIHDRYGEAEAPSPPRQREAT